MASTALVGLVLGPWTSGAVAAGVACPAPNGDAYSTAVLADTPLAYYRLDESAGPVMCDSSASGNNGTYFSSGITYGVSGALPASNDTAISANGTTGVVGDSNADPSGLTGNHDYTLEAWFKNTEATPTNHVLVAIGETCSYSGCNSVSTSNGQAEALALFPHHNSQLGWGPAAAFGIDQLGADYAWDATSAGVNLWDGNWHHLAVSYSASGSGASAFTGYVDGHNLGAPTPRPYGNYTPNIAAAPVVLGQWFNTFHGPLVGDLDEVALYGSTLSPARISAHYQAASTLTHTLSVSVSGMGTVTSSPSGISCPGTCSASFAAGTEVTLAATPASGYTFAGWSGGGCSGSGSCTVTMNGDESVTADFMPVMPGPVPPPSPTPAVPQVSTGAASGVTSSAATLKGTVNPEGQATSYRFQYGTSTAYASSGAVQSAVQSAGSGTSPEAVLAHLSGLKPGTTYHYRLVATSAAGTSYGADRTFTTKSRLALTVSTRGIPQAGVRKCYALRVTVNGRAERGATVWIGSRRARTNKTGRAQVCTALAAGRHTASATVRGLGTVGARFLVRAAPAPAPAPRFTG